MDWKHYVLALPIALFLLFMVFSLVGDTAEIMAEGETVAAESLTVFTGVDGSAAKLDCDEDSSDENGDEDEASAEDEDGESEDADGDEDQDGDKDDGDEDSCDEEQESEDGDED